MRLYERLAHDLESLIHDGSLRAGSRVPSIRQLCQDRGTSPSSVVRAYELLEARGLLQARARSGFFVTHNAGRIRPQATTVAAPRRRAERVDVSELVFQILDSTRHHKALPLGSAFPSPDLFPLQQLGRHLAYISRRLDPWNSVEDLPPGNLDLRRQIAQRYRLSGADVAPEEIVITAGALEALNLALQVVTRPNDIVAIESPCFYGCLQAIEAAGRRAIEIPTDPQRGLDLRALAAILERVPVKACWFMTTFHNPLGVTLSDAAKQQLTRLLASRGIPLIEDNVYSELYLGRERPRITKLWDQKGLVLDCGSFAKSLAPGYRLGWVAAGRFASEVWKRKVTTSLATSIPIQAAISHYLSSGVYDRHLRRLRRTLQQQQQQLLAAIVKHLPAGCECLRPEGGYQLWLRLPAGCDALALQSQLLEQNISVAPGPIFSARREYTGCLRLNYGHPWTQAAQNAMATLGKLIQAQLDGKRAPARLPTRRPARRTRKAT